MSALYAETTTQLALHPQAALSSAAVEVPTTDRLHATPPTATSAALSRSEVSFD